MKIKDWLLEATRELNKSQIKTAKLDAEILLADAIAVDRSWLHAHGDELLNEKIEYTIGKQLSRRIKHEPLAYIRGFQDFYGRKFNVDKFVLVPRPESEEIIDQFKVLQLPKQAKVADIGCGTGALGVTAKLEKPEIQLTMIDIDDNALNSARMNAEKFGIEATYFLGDLLKTHTATSYDVLLCNLPYVPNNYPINDAVMHEPDIALYSGDDGLDHFRLLFEQLSSGGYGEPTVITESLHEQHEQLKKTAKLAGYRIINEKDLVQVFKK